MRGERDCVGIMRAALAARAVSATAMNAASSRSHCVVSLLVQRARPGDGGVKFGKLCLVVGAAAAAAEDAIEVAGCPATALTMLWVLVVLVSVADQFTGPLCVCAVALCVCGGGGGEECRTWPAASAWSRLRRRGRPRPRAA